METGVVYISYIKTPNLYLYEGHKLTYINYETLFDVRLLSKSLMNES